MKLMDYSLLVGIHDIELEQQLQKERTAASPQQQQDDQQYEFHQQQASDLDSAGEQPSPPESPVPSTGAFTTNSALNLDDEFFAIPSSEGLREILIF